MTYPGVFALSSILFLIAFLFMRVDLTLKTIEQTTLVDPSSDESIEDHDDVGPEDKPV